MISAVKACPVATTNDDYSRQIITEN